MLFYDNVIWRKQSLFFEFSKKNESLFFLAQPLCFFLVIFTQLANYTGVLKIQEKTSTVIG